MESLVINPQTPNEAINLALDTIARQKQALLFVNTRSSAEKTAEDLSKKLFDSDKGKEMALKALKALSRPTKQCQRLALCLKKSVAFHHSGLTHRQRELIETSFRSGDVKVICCTPTLAMGVDLPAFRAIIKDLKRFGPRGMEWIPVLEYLQMSGRAGRPKFDKFGETIVIAKSEGELDKLVNKYLRGQPEEVVSKLAVEPVLRTYLLSLIASNFITTTSNMSTFFSKTLWAHQYRDLPQLLKILNKMLKTLESWQFVKMSGNNDEFVSADSLGRTSRVVATRLGRRVAELYIDPLTAHSFIRSLNVAKKKGLSPFSLLVMTSYSPEISPKLHAGSKDIDLINEYLVENHGSMLQKEPSIYEPEYEDFMDAVKTAIFFMEWIDEKDEEYLLEKFKIRPGEIRSKLDVADWLLYSTDELCRLLKYHSLRREVNKIRVRMRHGTREELFPLLQLKDIGRIRARKLYSNGIRGIAEVKAASITTLSQLIGPRISQNIKKQVGQEVKPTSPRKRKGQLGLGKYSG